MKAQKDITIKQVGLNGQISLGKEYAGKQVQISKLDNNCLIIKTGVFIPDSEKWLYQNNNLERLESAILQAESSPRRDNFEEIKKRILEDE